MTYVVPDGHDQNHRQGQSLVELFEAADLTEAVPVVESRKLGVAELGGDSAALGGNAVDGGGWDLDVLAVLDEELAHLVLLEASDDAVLRLALGCSKVSTYYSVI